MGKDLKGKELGDGLSQKKDGRYCARFTDRFGRRPEYKSKSLSECRKWLKEQKAMDTLEQNVVDDGITLDQYFLTWLDIHKYGIIKDNTKAGYIVHYKKHISPIFGKKKVSEIKKSKSKHYIIMSIGRGLRMRPVTEQERCYKICWSVHLKMDWSGLTKLKG